MFSFEMKFSDPRANSANTGNPKGIYVNKFVFCLT